MVIEAANSASLTINGKRTDQAVIDEALRLWIESGRSVRYVANRMDIPERTLHNWRVQHDWETKRLALASTIQPGLRAETAFGLQLAAHNAMKRLQQIALDALEGIEPNDKEVKSLTAIVDRGGHHPTALRPPDTPALTATTKPTNTTDLSTASPDELMAREREYRQRS